MKRVYFTLFLLLLSLLMISVVFATSPPPFGIALNKETGECRQYTYGLSSEWRPYFPKTYGKIVTPLGECLYPKYALGVNLTSCCEKFNLSKKETEIGSYYNIPLNETHFFQCANVQEIGLAINELTRECSLYYSMDFAHVCNNITNRCEVVQDDRASYCKKTFSEDWTIYLQSNGYTFIETPFGKCDLTYKGNLSFPLQAESCCAELGYKFVGRPAKQVEPTVNTWKKFFIILSAIVAIVVAVAFYLIIRFIRR